jgi:hypothetical protein
MEQYLDPPNFSSKIFFWLNAVVSLLLCDIQVDILVCLARHCHFQLHYITFLFYEPNHTHGLNEMSEQERESSFYQHYNNHHHHHHRQFCWQKDGGGGGGRYFFPSVV